MNQLISHLILYTPTKPGSLLDGMNKLFESFYKGEESKEKLVTLAYCQIKHLLEISTDYGFDGNLWHSYLTLFLITNENPFSLSSEMVGKQEGSVNFFSKNDFKIFHALFSFDFSKLERALGIDAFSHISHYQAIKKPDFMYNQNVSEKVSFLCKELEKARDKDAFFDEITRFYQEYGVGMFGLNKAFRMIQSEEKKLSTFIPSIIWIRSCFLI